jgi:2-polyprenyl-3-methyl-5-hydroxy-6-metoxy-1,4-benzoquinol methylase
MNRPENNNIALIVDHVFDLITHRLSGQQPERHLDIGAGWGHLIERLRSQYPGLKSWGLDYNPSHFPLEDVPIAHCDFSVDRIPHEDGAFDLVTCTEVCEHLENFRHAMREAARVLKPGGLIVVSTPNVLSMKSRWTYFTRGFFTYFDPLPLKDDPNLYPGQRHISPIPFFYLAHALMDAGLTRIEPHADKTQKSSAFWATVLSPLLQFVAWRGHARRLRHSGSLLPELERLAHLNNSWPALTGRTIVITACKPAA